MARKELVYIVDDSCDDRLLMKRLLEKIGFSRIEEISTGTEAFGIIYYDKTGKRIPDIILMDTQMPGNPGYEVCAALKKDERTKKIKIIGMSSIDHYRRDWISAGADAFFKKSYTNNALLEMEKILEKIHE